MRGILFVFMVPLVPWGCAGRAEYLIGRTRDLEGDLRGAYRDYHHAYRASGRRLHREARDSAGARIAEEMRLRGRRKEEAGDLEAALEAYLVALEYDPERGEISGDYLRAHARQDRLTALAEEASSRQGSWEAYRLWRELREEAATLPEVYLQVGRSAVAAADGDLSALWSGPGAPAAGLGGGGLPCEGLPSSLPRDGAALESLRLAWLELALELAGVRDQDGEDWGAAKLGALLASREEMARGAALAVEETLEGEHELSLASREEGAGRLEPAARSYQRALFFLPERPEVRDGLRRTVGALVQEAFMAAAGGLAHGDYALVLAQLERLERLEPGEPEIRSRVRRYRSQVQDGLLKEAARLRERGLPGNALAVFLRARALGAPRQGLDREIGLLEEGIRLRLKDRVVVDFRATPEEEEELDTALWGEDARGAVEAALARLFPAERSEEAGSRSAAAEVIPGRGSLLLVSIEDVDLDYRLERMAAGSVESRFVSEFVEVDNPDHRRAREEFAEARAALERARQAVAASGGDHEGLALLSIAEGRERRAAANVGRTPARIPYPVWRSESFPVVKVRVRATLGLRVRIDSESRWLEAKSEAEDREVEGDSRRGIAPDPGVVPTRAQALASLAPLVAERLTSLVEEREEARRGKLFEEARERVQSGAYESAVEDLMAFLYSRRASGTGEEAARRPLFGQAADLLRKLTGCDLPRAWEKPAEPRLRPF
jgi:tetratricopeptide (TPR) repeat protein